MPLYQVRSGSSSTNTGTGGTLKDIPQTVDGFADTSIQDPLCSGTVCTVATIYDQSGNGNNLIRGSAGSTNGGAYAGMTDFESSATKGSLMVNGHKVYALYMNQYEGYRTPLNVKAKGVPLGNTAQGIYELADGTHAGTACCWDFGSVSPDPNDLRHHEHLVLRNRPIGATAPATVPGSWATSREASGRAARRLAIQVGAG